MSNQAWNTVCPFGTVEVSELLFLIFETFFFVTRKNYTLVKSAVYLVRGDLEIFRTSIGNLKQISH